MTRIKKKEQRGVPKVHDLRISTNQADRMMKQVYLKRRAQSHKDEEQGTEYATGQVEHTVEWVADEMTIGVPAAITQQLTQPRLQKWKQPQPEPAPDTLRDEFVFSEQELVPDTESAAHPFENKRKPNPPRPKPADETKLKGHPVTDPVEQLQGPSMVSCKHTVLHTMKKRIASDTVVTSPTEAVTQRKNMDSSFTRRELMQYTDGVRQFKAPEVQQYPTVGFQNVRANRHRRCQNAAFLKMERPNMRELYSAGTPKTRSTILPGHEQEKTVIPTRPEYPKSRASLVGTAKQSVQQNMKRQMLANTKKAAKSVATITKHAVQAAAKAATCLASLLVSVVGSTALLVTLVCVIVIAAVASSPFGLFFAEEKTAPDTVSVAEAVGMVNAVYNARLEEIQIGAYDSIEIHGQTADWPEILAVFAVKLAGADAGVDVATLDVDRVDRLTAVFWDMNGITSGTETIEHESEGNSWTETILHIAVEPKSADEMRTVYAFTEYQNSALDEMLANRAALSSLAGSLNITDADIQKVLTDLPEELSETRRQVVEKALSLVGKVNYFWGGKSNAIGWDSRWGTLQKVTAAGSPSTGTYRPFGLDCSGMIDWTLHNVGLPSDGNWYIGVNLTEISLSDAQPGDMALFADASHIGIIVGRNESGELLVCHSSSGRNNVVVTEFSETGFVVAGKSNVFVS